MDKRHTQYFSMLNRVPIFSAISKDKLEQLFDRCEIVDKKVGDYLIHEDTQAEEVFVILEGSVTVKLNQGGHEIEVAQLREGNCLGEASVIGIQNHSANVILIEDSSFLVLSRTLLMKLYSDDLELFSLLVLNIARELARRLKAADHYIEEHR